MRERGERGEGEGEERKKGWGYTGDFSIEQKSALIFDIQICGTGEQVRRTGWRSQPGVHPALLYTQERLQRPSERKRRATCFAKGPFCEITEGHREIFRDNIFPAKRQESCATKVTVSNVGLAVLGLKLWLMKLK